MNELGFKEWFYVLYGILVCSLACTITTLFGFALNLMTFLMLDVTFSIFAYSYYKKAKETKE